MNRGRLIGLLLGLAALLAVGGALPPPTHAASQDVNRLSGDFKNFNGSETTTDSWVTVFNKCVFVPAGMTALYITVSATGETAGEGTVLKLRCKVDGYDCHAAGAYSGYLKLQNQPENRPDNAVYHTWCKSLYNAPLTSPTLKNVEITMKSSDGEEVALEAAHLFVDASDLAVNACNDLGED